MFSKLKKASSERFAALAAIGMFATLGVYAATPGDQTTPSGPAATPTTAAGNQHALFVLAQSSTGRVGTIAVPVIVGNLTPAVPTRTP